MARDHPREREAALFQRPGGTGHHVLAFAAPAPRRFARARRHERWQRSTAPQRGGARALDRMQFENWGDAAVEPGAGGLRGIGLRRFTLLQALTAEECALGQHAKAADSANQAVRPSSPRRRRCSPPPPPPPTHTPDTPPHTHTHTHAHATPPSPHHHPHHHPAGALTTQVAIAERAGADARRRRHGSPPPRSSKGGRGDAKAPAARRERALALFGGLGDVANEASANKVRRRAPRFLVARAVAQGARAPRKRARTRRAAACRRAGTRRRAVCGACRRRRRVDWDLPPTPRHGRAPPEQALALFESSNDPRAFRRCYGRWGTYLTRRKGAPRRRRGGAGRGGAGRGGAGRGGAGRSVRAATATSLRGGLPTKVRRRRSVREGARICGHGQSAQGVRHAQMCAETGIRRERREDAESRAAAAASMRESRTRPTRAIGRT